MLVVSFGVSLVLPTAFSLASVFIGPAALPFEAFLLKVLLPGFHPDAYRTCEKHDLGWDYLSTRPQSTAIVDPCFAGAAEESPQAI